MLNYALEIHKLPPLPVVVACTKQEYLLSASAPHNMHWDKPSYFAFGTSQGNFVHRGYIYTCISSPCFAS